jgi:hypothetical protein
MTRPILLGKIGMPRAAMSSPIHLTWTGNPGRRASAAKTSTAWLGVSRSLAP